jgi:ATP-dependent Clp protease ATP-binding subunit ClpA
MLIRLLYFFNQDFFYICPIHLKDRGFCSPIVDAEQAAKKKKEEELAREIEKVKQEYEEKQKLKREKEKEKEKKKEKDDNGKNQEKDQKKSDTKTDDLEKEKEQKVGCIHGNIYSIFFTSTVDNDMCICIYMLTGQSNSDRRAQERCCRICR